MKQFKQLKALLSISFLLPLLLSNYLKAQGTYSLSNDCSTNTGIEAHIKGIDGESAPFIDVGSIATTSKLLVSVWIEGNDCSSGFPNNITISNGTQSLTASGVNIIGTGAQERIYRAEINNPTSSTVNISNLGTCTAKSVSVQKVYTVAGGNAAYAFAINQEFHNSNQTYTVNIGTATVARNITIQVPIHEKGNDGRIARVEVWGTGVPMVANEISMQTHGAEAGLIVVNVPNVPTSVTQLQVKIISPNTNGESFGVDMIAAWTTSNCCDNFTNGGTIAANEANCGGFNPANITSSVAPSGGTGTTTEYIWEQSTNNGTTWTAISGATTLTYDPPAITQTTQYRRGARRTSCGTYIYSNVITKDVVNNINNGGNISGNQSNCGSFDPTNITEIATASGGNGGTVQYIWEQSIDNGSNWTVIGSATAATHDPASISQTTLYRRGARRSGCTPYVYSNTITKEVTASFTDGGSIVGDETNCGSYNPNNITSSTLPSGGVSGTTEYIWQLSTNNGTSWATISGATSTTYDPPSITQTTQYRRGARRSGCTTYIYSNVVTKQLLGNFTYGGAITGNQSGCNNYDPTIMPQAQAPSGLAGSPTIEYSWEQSINNGVNWTIISGATSESYDPPSISQTTQYRRGARSSSCTSYVYTNVITKTVHLPSVGGTVSATTNAFCGLNLPAGLFTLSGHTGGVLQWDWSTDGVNWYGWLWTNSTSSPSRTLTNGGTFYARAVVKNGTCGNAFSSVASITVTANAGNPNEFGCNKWNVYAYEGGNIDLQGLTYSGYYTEPNYCFSTSDKWNINGSPSNAAGYQGCTVSADNHTFVYKRSCFPCGNYTLDIPAHDDSVRVYINGVEVYQKACCAGQNNVWSGYLNAASTVEIRVREIAGGSSLTACLQSTFSLSPVALSATTITNVCPTAYVNLNSLVTSTPPAGTNLVWFNNQAHTGSPYNRPDSINTIGTYYAFYHDPIADCYSPSVSVQVNINCCSNSEFTLTGHAALHNGYIKLTPELNEMSGQAWSNVAVNLNENFSQVFRVYAGNRDANGADGFAFLFKGNSPLLVGLMGGALGYGYISPSLAIEFDTWANLDFGDVVNDHIAVHTGGNWQTSGRLGANVDLGNLEDDLWHDVVIDWKHATKNLTITFDGVVIYNITRDIVNLDFAGSSLVNFGFTASTGGAFNEQSVCVQKVTYEPCRAGAVSPVVAATTTCMPVNLNTLITSNPPNMTSLQWFTNDTHTGAQYSTPTAATAGTYYAFFYDAINDCYSPASVAITVVDNVTNGGVIAGDQSNCGSFDPTALTSTSVASGGTGGIIEYVWEQSTNNGTNWTAISGATATTYDPATISQTTQYRRGARRTSCAYIYSNIITKTVNTVPTVSAGTGQTLCGTNNTINLTATASGGVTPYAYSWSNGLGSTATVTTTPTTTTTYTVTVTGANNCPATSSVQIIVRPLPTVTSITKQDETCDDDNGSITFIFNEPPSESSIAFSIDGGNSYPYVSLLTGQNSFTIPNLSANIYDLWVRWGDNACPINLSDRVINNNGQEPTLTMNGSQTICPSVSATISAVVSGGTAPFNYLWDKGLSNNSTHTIFPASTITHTVIVTGANGCAATNSVTVTVNPCPEICDNGIDDDQDGFIDCDDTDCQVAVPAQIIKN